MKMHGFILAVVGVAFVSGCIGAPEESVNPDEISDSAAHVDEASDQEGAGEEADMSPEASTERVYAFSRDGITFTHVPSGDEGPLLPGDTDPLSVPSPDGLEASSSQDCDLGKSAGTMTLAVGDSCSWCGSNVWWCAGKRKYEGTVVLKSDGYYCEGSAYQMACC